MNKTERVAWCSDPYPRLLLVISMPRVHSDQQNRFQGISDFKVSQVTGVCGPGGSWGESGDDQKGLCEKTTFHQGTGRMRGTGTSHRKGWWQSILEGQVQRARWEPAVLSLRTARLCTQSRGNPGGQAGARVEGQAQGPVPTLVCVSQLWPYSRSGDSDSGNKKKREKSWPLYCP